MTVGLRHVATAAAFVIATNTVVQHANAQFNLEDCNISTLVLDCVDQSPTCDQCNAASANEAVFDCLQEIDSIVDECEFHVAYMCCYNQVTGADCIGDDHFWELFSCNAGYTCDVRTCDGAPSGGGGGTSPTPATTTTPAPAAASAGTVAPASFAASSISDCLTEFQQPCLDDATCSACLAADVDVINECVGAIDFVGLEACEAQTANYCCFSEAAGVDCLGNDAFWDYFTCGVDQTICDTRTCDGAPSGGGGGTAPTPAATPTSPAPAAAAAETAATVAPAEAGFVTAAPSSAAGTEAPLSSTDASPEPTPSAEGGSGGLDADGGATPEPTSTAERAISITQAPTTAEEAEDADASGTNGAGLGASRSPVGLVVAGLVAVAAFVGDV